MINSIIPYARFTQFTPSLPEFYWDVYSAEQRIKHMCMELGKIVAYCDMLGVSINAIEDRMNKTLDEFMTEIEREIDSDFNRIQTMLFEFKDEVMRILSEMQLSNLQWDVQYGKLETSTRAQRDMFNDVTLHSYNIEQLDEIFDTLEMDVDGLADCGLNVKGFSLVNHVLLMPSGLTDDLTYDSSNFTLDYFMQDNSQS